MNIEVDKVQVFPNKLVTHYSIKESDESVGCFVIVYGTGFARLTGLYVAPQHRGRDYGNNALDFALKSCAKTPIYIECDRFELMEKPDHCAMDDESLRNWYLGNGFVPVEGHPFAMVYHPRNSPSPRQW